MDATRNQSRLNILFSTLCTACSSLLASNGILAEKLLEYARTRGASAHDDEKFPTPMSDGAKLMDVRCRFPSTTRSRHGSNTGGVPTPLGDVAALLLPTVQASMPSKRLKWGAGFNTSLRRRTLVEAFFDEMKILSELRPTKLSGTKTDSLG